MQYSKYLAQLVVFVLRVVDLADVPYEVPFTTEQRSAIASFTSALAQSPTDSSLHPPLHSLLFSLVAHSSTDPLLGKWFTPITRFQVLSAVTAHGDFLNTNDIRRLNAQLIYIMRAVMFTEITSRMQSQNQTFFPVYNELRPYLIVAAETPYAYCAALAGILRAAESKDQMLPTVQFKDHEHTIILHHDIEFSYTSIASVIKGAIAEYDSILNDTLLFGISIEDDPDFALPSDLSALYDQPQNFDPGFNFFDDPRNNLGRLQHVLLRHMLEDYGPKGFYHYVDGEKCIFRMQPALRFLKSAFEAEQRLCTMLHFSYGQPARGEELATVTVRNPRHGAGRNLHIMQGFVTILTGYWKCADQTGHDKLIARVPCPAVAQRLLFYLGVIRPVQIAFARVFLDKDAVERYTDYLFPGFHKPVDGEFVSACLRADTETYLTRPIGLKDYRQLISALSRWNRSYYPPDEPPHPYELQRGHETTTYDRRYGISTDMLAGADPRRLT
ncbi:hypothetical protein EVJ58_g10425, partial [Rhodofomes roseus]